MPLPEKALIAQIRRMAAALGTVPAGRQDRPTRNARAGAVRIGIGDDCAVLGLLPGQELLVTTDFSLEGIHFRRDWQPPESIGHRCLARGLSDIAAMGGKPVAAFLSLAVPRKLPQAWVRRFTDGLMRLSSKFGITLAGGDTAESPGGVVADIVLIGGVPKGHAVLRSGAHPGDQIFVSGSLGGSAAAILRLQAESTKKVKPQDYARHFYPEPRIEVGSMLRKNGLASAMIDTSDGLSTDLAHICEESGVGALINSDLIPRAHVGNPAHEVGLDLALHGGEDYELLFTVPKGKRVPSQIAGVALTRIGQVTRSRKILLRSAIQSPRKLTPRGWEHFRKVSMLAS